MNFPATKKTGTLAEIDAERLFISWSWVVGHDRIDVGYDLNVMPDRMRYKGARFAVQVKGTVNSDKKGNVTALVRKARLRQYAEDLLPVFIVRSTPDGLLYWLDAQEWAKTNERSLLGDGSLSIRFKKDQILTNRAEFEKHLEKALSQSFKGLKPKTDLEKESLLLNSIDENFGVTIFKDAGRIIHEVFAKSESASPNLMFTPSTSPENLTDLEDLYGYGLPCSVDVDNLEVKGPPLFEHILSPLGKGKLSIAPLNSETGFVHLIPGKKRSITSSEMIFAVYSTSGTKGFAFTNSGKPSEFDISLRLTKSHDRLKPSAKISFRSLSISGKPIKNLHFLATVEKWAGQVLRYDSLFIEIHFKNNKINVPMSDKLTHGMRHFINFSITIAKLHLIAKTVNSNFVITIPFELSAADVADIELAYSLLKGERRLVKQEFIEFTPLQPLEKSKKLEFLFSTTLVVSILGQQLCEIPVDVELADYSIEDADDLGKIRIVRSPTGTAWMSYCEAREK